MTRTTKTCSSLFCLGALWLAACVTSADPAQGSSARATLGEREAADVIANHEAIAADCKTRPTFGCLLYTIDRWHPCDPPRRITQLGLPVNEPIERSDLYGTFFFDGTSCYQATREAPGPCTELTAGAIICQGWTTLEACTAARRVCTERGR